jgi:hypothetical protein
MKQLFFLFIFLLSATSLHSIERDEIVLLTSTDTHLMNLQDWEKSSVLTEKEHKSSQKKRENFGNKRFAVSVFDFDFDDKTA